MNTRSAAESHHGCRSLETEGMIMRIVTFDDGTSCRIARVRGDHFEPCEGEPFLFEFPEGSLKQGAVSAEGAAWFLEHLPLHDCVFDAQSRIVSLEI